MSILDSSSSITDDFPILLIMNYYLDDNQNRNKNGNSYRRKLYLELQNLLIETL